MCFGTYSTIFIFIPEVVLLPEDVWKVKASMCFSLRDASTPHPHTWWWWRARSRFRPVCFTLGKEKGKIGCFSCVFGWAWQSVGLRFLESKLPCPEFRLFPLFAMDRINMWIPRGKTLPAVDRLLLAPPAIRGRKERGKEREEGVEWIGKQKRRPGARSLAGPGPGILSAAWGRRAEQDLLHDPSAGLDRMIYSRWNSEMGASRIARKELS